MTTTAAVKINRADVMKRAWQIFKAKAVRTMQAWSDALRSAWKLAKGGSVVEVTEQAESDGYVQLTEKISYKVLSTFASNVKMNVKIKNSNVYTHDFDLYISPWKKHGHNRMYVKESGWRKHDCDLGHIDMTDMSIHPLGRTDQLIDFEKPLLSTVVHYLQNKKG